jgi:putative sugar O-methyltransferase
MLLTKYLLKKYSASTKTVDAGREVAKLSKRLFDFDCAKQVLSLNLIEKKVDVNKVEVATIIGDGYGFMSCLLLRSYPHLKIININLGRTLFFDTLAMQSNFPQHQTELLLKEPGSNSLSKITFIAAENYKLLEDIPCQLYINIASMQEMNNDVIRNYFSFIKNNPSEISYFYCCNRKEKRLPDGEVTKILEYPWEEFKVLHKEACPWYQKYPVGHPPFWKCFDGEILHFLAIREVNNKLPIRR